MKYSIILFCLALLFAASSCEKVIEAKNLPEQDARLVTNCILYADSQVKANISASKSILSGKNYKYLDNAVCELYEDDSFAGNLKLAGSGNYTSTIIPKTGRKYTLKVTAAGYNGISATTSLPGNVSLAGAERYDTTNYRLSVTEYSTGPSQVSRYVQGTLKYKIRISDDPSVRNYYSLRPVLVLYDESGDTTVVDRIYISSSGTGIGSDNSTSYGESVSVDDQVLINGNEIQLDVEINISTSVDFSYKIRNMKVFLSLYNLSPEYYKYLVTLNNQVNTGASFFAEPVQVFSNVSNGMGIVAGVNTNSVQIYPK